MNELKIRGTQSFMGKEIPVVFGGFGADKKCVSDKTIAEIHNQPEREIRKSINRNIDRFREKVDFIDLKKGGDEITTSELLADLSYTKQMIVQADHIYILSERGYAKLIKIMDTDLAWEIHDKLMDEYFTLRDGARPSKTNANSITQKQRSHAMELNAKSRLIKEFKSLYQAANIKPEYQIMALQDFCGSDAPRLPRESLEPIKRTYDKTTIAKRLGVFSVAGLPHAQAVGAIIERLDIPESEYEKVPYMRNGHDGFDWQYSEAVVNMVSSWLKNNNHPAEILNGSRTLRIKYVQ